MFRLGCKVPSGPFCLRCRYPSSQYDKMIVDLDENSLEWCDPYGGEYGDESRLGLFLGIGLLFFILIIVTAGLILRYQFWHSAHYYTHEETRVCKVPFRVNAMFQANENEKSLQMDTGLTPPPQEDDFMMEGSQQYYATINGTHTKIISTIDEKSFNPDANFYPDLTTNLNLNPLYRPPSAVSPSIGSKSEHSFIR